MARRAGFSIHSLMGAILGGVTGYFSMEIGEAIAGVLKIDLGGDKVKTMLLGLAAAFLALPMLGGIILGRLSKTWTGLGLLIGAIARAFTSGLFNLGNNQPQ